MTQSVLISGGGIVGSYLGLELAARNIPFQIIEKSHPNPSPIDHIRTLTLNLSAFERLNALDVKTSAASIQTMNVLDGVGTGQLVFNAQDANLDYLAKVLSFNALKEALSNQVVDSTTAGKYIVSFASTGSGVEVVLSDGSDLKADLLVIAEGRNSELAQSIGSESFDKDYQQIAQTFFVDVPELNTTEAIQIFHEKEIFALMPFNNHSSSHQFSVVWSAPKDSVVDLSVDNIGAHLHKFEKKLSCKIKVTSEILSFPLTSHHLNEYCDEGVCVIADSAHSIHPLAGQGINLGLADASVLADEIQNGISAGKDIGQLAFLKKYELRRKTLNSAMIKGVDLLFNLFQEESPYLRLLRNSGLKAVNKFSLLKKNFILHASGIHKI